MDYRLHYDALIARARNRMLRGYSERHHVIPRCLGGTDATENLVRLRPEEHYVAHLLLAKMHPRSRKLACAVMAMSMANGKMPVGSRNKIHGWFRRRFSRMMLNHEVTDETRAKLSVALVGRKVSEERRASLATYNLGKKRSNETREKMRLAQLGKRHSPETIAKMAQTNRRVLSEEQKVARRAYHHTDEARRRISAAGKGLKRSDEFRANLRGKRSAETVEKIRAAALRREALRRVAREGSKCLPINNLPIPGDI